MTTFFVVCAALGGRVLVVQLFAIRDWREALLRHLEAVQRGVRAPTA